MKVQILGCSADAVPARHYASNYLINDVIAIDAGPLGYWCGPAQQTSIRHVFLTHSHTDHLATLPIFLENAFDLTTPAVVIHGSRTTLDALREHVFNDVIWPDFIRLSRPERPFLVLNELVSEQAVQVGDVSLLPVLVSHNVPTFGYIVTDGKSTVIFGGDSGPTDRIWERAHEFPEPRTVFLESAFPNAMTTLAQISAHLTPSMFAREICKMPPLSAVIAVHIKVRFRECIERELRELGVPGLVVGASDVVYDV